MKLYQKSFFERKLHKSHKFSQIPFFINFKPSVDYNLRISVRQASANVIKLSGGSTWNTQNEQKNTDQVL